ncbi:hypothetical protein ACUXCC_001952 [Cytobacillus horneckiae]|uniref:Uncharacterized protein n=1 Tax=Cytobacillus horneckiae TaxID=549687 RepID=A0A2N0Z997_9BACI|nr:hypothetical protein [Cytobacillus horneckiae]NRG48417.1 hypothetical protein [Bacillus sp. CRN 9]MBN6886583.1 hypothetical protein [Cytobacillus horneckiae]MCM3177948.1 hypothetical protein [Cytobacillus horneckiae]MEC1159198.1 hypothetical protein [Cytobacillus horneckiae]MED2935885.1 hypothetical protein [Cytobacillus horneckiae]
MTKLLDARTSQNASYANSISDPISTTPELFARLSLNAANANGIVRTQMSGTVAVQLPLLPVISTITVTIVRGSNPSVLIYSAENVLDTSILGPQIISFTASDFNVPIPANNNVVYTVYIQSSILGTIRVGPESFNAAIYSD